MLAATFGVTKKANCLIGLRSTALIKLKSNKPIIILYNCCFVVRDLLSNRLKLSWRCQSNWQKNLTNNKEIVHCYWFIDLKNLIINSNIWGHKLSTALFLYPDRNWPTPALCSTIEGTLNTGSHNSQTVFALLSNCFIRFLY